MASRDWIQQTNARLQELHTLRVRYVHALETSVDPHVLRTHTKEIEKIDTEIAHLQAAMQFADQRPASMPATPGPSDGEPETFNRDEYTDILDDGERPTEHWDPNAQVGPGGQTMAEALAQGALGFYQLFLKLSESMEQNAFGPQIAAMTGLQHEAGIGHRRAGFRRLLQFFR